MVPQERDPPYVTATYLQNSSYGKSIFLNILVNWNSIFLNILVILPGHHESIH